MARLKNRLFGGISGRIGDVEGFIRNGIPYVRARKRKTKTQPSLKQLVQRKRMALVNAFIDSMTPFVRLGFGLQAKGKAFSANNAAKSYQLNHSMQGEYPDFSINYEAVSLTRGQLPLPPDLQAIPEGNGIRFSWTYDPLTNWLNVSSIALILKTKSCSDDVMFGRPKSKPLTIYTTKMFQAFKKKVFFQKKCVSSKQSSFTDVEFQQIKHLNHD